jgi:hypothetical protein
MTKARDLASAIPAPSTVSSAELGYLDGVTSAIQTQVDAKIAKTLTTTTGDIIYASGANTPARLGIGSSAQVLTVASGVPSWATPAGGGGKLLQVVYGTTSTGVNVATTTYTDTGLTATITPTSATSTILVFVNQQGLSAAGGQANIGAGLRLLRGSTAIYTPDNASKYGQQFVASSANMTNHASMMSFAYQDSPATTSSTTYKVQGATQNTAGGGQTIFQESSSASNIVLMEIGA